MTDADVTYQDILSDILINGDDVPGRNGNTRRLCVKPAVFTTCPLITLRKCFWKGALREMEWFLSGSNKLDDLHPTVRHWWQPWVDSTGYIPNNYSVQFRDSYGRNGSFDQLEYLLQGLRQQPHSRRLCITTWNTADMAATNTPITNCHGTVIQLFCSSTGVLDMFTYQRSVDVMLGMPHNWVQYWAFLVWLCHKSLKVPGRLTWAGGDVHIYQQHQEEARKILKVCDENMYSPRETFYLDYNLKLDESLGESDFLADNFTLIGDYRPLTDTKLEMVV